MATDEFEKENEKIAWIMAGIILIITVVLNNIAIPCSVNT